MKPTLCSRSFIVRVAALTLILGVLAVPLSAQRYKEGQSPLDKLTLVKPELLVSRKLTDAERLSKGVWNREAMAQFRSDNGSAWHALVDERTGRVNLLDGGAIPLIPVPANKLRWQNFEAKCESISYIPLSRMESLARNFLKRYLAVMRVNLDELSLDAAVSAPVGNSIYFLRFQWTHGGVPVEGASVFFTIHNGNLIQVGMRNIGDIKLDPKPTISAKKAWQVLRAYVGGVADKDYVFDKGTLSIFPVTPKGLDPDALKVPFGRMIDYVLVYKLAFYRPGVLGMWEALVDAHTGELLSFRDSNA